MGISVSKTKTNGFTIVELLIVIVVIAILAAITIVAYNGIQARARDTRRANDIAQIKKALLAYDAVHGGVVRPNVPGYTKPTGEPSYSGWDVSTSANWLVFLRNGNGMMPVDPVNTNPDAVSPNGGDNRLYYYYCYNAGSSSAYPDSAGVRLNYRLESGAVRTEAFRVSSCLTSIPAEP